MDYEANPFQELYVTDSPDPTVFVKLFSDYPVKHAHALFRPGNVVLKGTQGSGKSMLLNLFRPKIRWAYHQAEQEFPVPPPLAKFIGAGINLTRSGALDIGQRSLGGDRDQEENVFPLYFADFVNYYIVRDILESVKIIGENASAFNSLAASENLDEFVQTLVKEDCWFGALEDCTTFKELCTAIDKRITGYRAFHNANSDLPSSISSTKTDIGEPIARTAEALKACSVIARDVSVFVRIDQLERLYRSDVIRPTLGHQYRRVINKALGSRDQRVSYRIGTRRYAWQDDLKIFGTTDELENLRDFRVIDIDDMLRRKEDPKTWIFPDFAEDAFARRVRTTSVLVTPNDDLIQHVFGTTPSPDELARKYAKNSTAERMLKMGDDWPPAWRKFLLDLFRKDPLEATLASAWVRQQGSRKERGTRLAKRPPTKTRPWNGSYWRKERVRQCLLQIAARSAQRLNWSGKDHIIALSSGNISIFLSVCHEIWEAFLRSERRKKSFARRDPISAKESIDPDVQAVGIHTASASWYEKVTEQPNGHDRQRFLNVIGPFFRARLVDDDAMSYPGNNGFSLSQQELQDYPSVRRFLEDAADYGDLYETVHTTKLKDRKIRRKWYLSPILSPWYQLPESHVKEPYYASIEEMARLMLQAEIQLPDNLPKVPKSNQRRKAANDKSPTLFDPRTEQ